MNPHCRRVAGSRWPDPVGSGYGQQLLRWRVASCRHERNVGNRTPTAAEVITKYYLAPGCEFALSKNGTLY
jgi:hypothetical protein